MSKLLEQKKLNELKAARKERRRRHPFLYFLRDWLGISAILFGIVGALWFLFVTGASFVSWSELWSTWLLPSSRDGWVIFRCAVLLILIFVFAGVLMERGEGDS